MTDSQVANTGAVVKPGLKTKQFLTFHVSGETYGVEVFSTREIIEFAQITEVPLAPEFVKGVMNLRGRVVPIIDLSLRFDQQKTEINRRTCIIIVQLENEADIGVVVDGVHEVVDIPVAHIEPAPGFGTKIRTAFIAGMAKIDEEFLVLLKIDRVLSYDEMMMLTQAAAETYM